MRKGPKISNHQLNIQWQCIISRTLVRWNSKSKHLKRHLPDHYGSHLKTSDIWSLIASWHAYPPPNPRHHPRHSPKTLPHALQWKSFIKEKAQHWKDQLLNPAAAALHLMKRCSLTCYLGKLSPLNDTNWPNSSKHHYLLPSKFKMETEALKRFFPKQIPKMTSHSTEEIGCHPTHSCRECTRQNPKPPVDPWRWACPSRSSRLWSSFRSPQIGSPSNSSCHRTRLILKS